MVVEGTDEEREGEGDEDCMLLVLVLPLPPVAMRLGLEVRFCINLSVIFFSSIHHDGCWKRYVTEKRILCGGKGVTRSGIHG